MSTFSGPIKEIPGISVDRFDNENLASSAYFLSHCHSDHMQGLNRFFIENLEEHNKFLYCSEVSKIILDTRSNLISSEMIRSLCLFCPVIIDFKSENGDTCFVSVTLIPAGHCPGSVMFLFQFNEQKILYTGDFRIDPDDFPKLKPLHDSFKNYSSPMKLDKVYLDTTFLKLGYLKIPKRRESIEEIRQAAKNWLDRDPKNVVLLLLGYNYGREYVFKEVSIVMNQKIHVGKCEYMVYSRIKELSPFFTDNSKGTSIHGCLLSKYSSSGRLLCREDVDERNLYRINITAFKWEGKLDSGVIKKSDELNERKLSICYSSHASCEELKAFIEYFRPKEIFPCVLPTNENEQIEVYKLLEEFSKSNVEKRDNVKLMYELKLPKPGSSTKNHFKSEIFTEEEND